MTKTKTVARNAARERLEELAWETDAIRLGKVWVIRCQKEGKRLTIYGATEQEVWQEAVKRAEAKVEDLAKNGRKTARRPR